MGRSIDELSPELRTKYSLFDQKMKEKGISYTVTSTGRSILVQMALYVQGRLPVSEVNNFRTMASLPLIKESENKKVTWTLKSKHITNALDEDLNNDFSDAFDIAIVKEGKPIWEIKVDVNGDMVPDYEQAGQIGEEVGLKWGGRFSTPDYPHFEI